VTGEDDLLQLVWTNSGEAAEDSILPAKQRSLSCCTATNAEVFRIVMQRKIHTASSLLKYAKELSALGDQRFLLYCVGRGGKMKANLQATINTMWQSQQHGKSDEMHVRPLPKEKALFMAQLCCERAAPPSMHMPPTAVAIKPTSEVFPAAGSKLPEALFDELGLPAALSFHPRGGLWRLRDFFELLLACREESALKGVAPSEFLEGGLRIPRTEAGWRMLLRAGVTKKRVHFSQLDADDHRGAAAELRFRKVCRMPWRPPGSTEKNQEDTDAWARLMPLEASFEVNAFDARLHEDRLVILYAAGHVQADQLLAVWTSLCKCGHTIHETFGFKVKNGTDVILQGRHGYNRGGRVSQGAYGARLQMQDKEEKAQGVKRMLVSGKSGSGWVDRPPMNRKEKKEYAAIRAGAGRKALRDSPYGCS